MNVSIRHASFPRYTILSPREEPARANRLALCTGQHEKDFRVGEGSYGKPLLGVNGNREDRRVCDVRNADEDTY